jgi:hypothetical protein
MDNGSKYTIDTCSFTALNRVYPFDVVPGAWDALGEMADSGIINSSYEILLELEVQDDGVFEWARNHKQIFLPLESDIQNKATEILRNYPNILDIKQSKSSADPFLIATAIVTSCKVVTEEKPTGLGSKKIKIPDVCRQINLECISLLDMMRAEGVKLYFNRSSTS